MKNVNIFKIPQSGGISLEELNSAVLVEEKKVEKKKEVQKDPLLLHLKAWEVLADEAKKNVLECVLKLCETGKFTYSQSVSGDIFFEPTKSYSHAVLQRFTSALFQDLNTPKELFELLYEKSDKKLFFIQALEFYSRQFSIEIKYDELSLHTHKIAKDSKKIDPEAIKTWSDILLLLFKDKNSIIRLLAAKIFLNISSRLGEEEILQLLEPILLLSKSSELLDLDAKVISFLGFVHFIHVPGNWKNLNKETKEIFVNLILEMDFEDKLLLSPVARKSVFLIIQMFSSKIGSKSELFEFEDIKQEEKKQYADILKWTIEYLINAVILQELDSPKFGKQSDIFDGLLSSKNKFIRSISSSCIFNILEENMEIFFEKNDERRKGLLTAYLFFHWYAERQKDSFLKEKRSSLQLLLAKEFRYSGVSNKENFEIEVLEKLFTKKDSLHYFMLNSEKEKLKCHIHNIKKERKIFSTYFNLYDKQKLCGEIEKKSAVATIFRANSESSFKIIFEEIELDKNSESKLEKFAKILMLLKLKIPKECAVDLYPSGKPHLGLKKYFF